MVEAPKAPHLSVVIPAFNEAARLPATLAALADVAPTWPFNAEVVLVDDGSTDATAAVMDAFAAGHDDVRVVRQPRNLGKGAAVTAGVLAACGRFVVFFDADLSYPLEAVPEAVERLEAGADVVVGARDLHPDAGRAAYSPLRRATSLAFNAYVEGMLGLGIPDTQCGFKAFRGEVARELFPRLSIPGFGFDVELLYAAKARGFAIARMPIRMRTHDTGSVRVLQHGLRMAGDVLKVRLRAWRGVYGKRARG
jgi:dolichyl-phosphate beta-glucosyltransferase